MLSISFLLIALVTLRCSIRRLSLLWLVNCKCSDVADVVASCDHACARMCNGKCVRVHIRVSLVHARVHDSVSILSTCINK